MSVKDRRRDDFAARLATGLAAYALGRAADDVMTPERGGAEISEVRHLAMYLAHVGFSMSMTRVGEVFGRDRSTVAYACRRIEDARDDARFDQWIDALEGALREAPPPDSHPRERRA